MKSLNLAGKLWDFLIWTESMIKKIAQPSPIPQADTYFIDGPTGGNGYLDSFIMVNS